jgi:hypothetical protein
MRREQGGNSKPAKDTLVERVTIQEKRQKDTQRVRVRIKIVRIDQTDDLTRRRTAVR